MQAGVARRAVLASHETVDDASGRLMRRAARLLYSGNMPATPTSGSARIALARVQMAVDAGDLAAGQDAAHIAACR
jgi:hypothetical protein